MRFNWRRSLALALHALQEAGLTKGSAVVLIGSFAHGATTWRSDLDLLVLLRGTRRPKIKVPFGVHFHFEDADQFRSRLAQGDDYATAAVKFGKVIHDSLNLWESLREQMKTARWPDWRDKVGQAQRRIRLGGKLLGIGDLDAATEEYLLGATQISRAMLLRCGIYPLSRMELPKQLITIGQAKLAADIRALIEGECGEEQLRKIGEELQRVLLLEGAKAT